MIQPIHHNIPDIFDHTNHSSNWITTRSPNKYASVSDEIKKYSPTCCGMIHKTLSVIFHDMIWYLIIPRRIFEYRLLSRNLFEFCHSVIKFLTHSFCFFDDNCSFIVNRVACWTVFYFDWSCKCSIHCVCCAT
jgi:hypothetical protein